MTDPARILWQLQLSCYDVNGVFNLTADSNWQVFVTKARQMVKVSPKLLIDVLVPPQKSCSEDMWDMLKEHNLTRNVRLVHVPIAPNAVRTRYDFPWHVYAKRLEQWMKTYTHVYVNDPMLTRHFRAMMYLMKSNAKLITQVHFLDSPTSPIVDDRVSYWHGTIEGCTKSDVCLMHCDSMTEVFRNNLCVDYSEQFVERLMYKVDVWKSGYSIDEINEPINYDNVRFDLVEATSGKKLVWVPNRIGGLGLSLDYTNNGYFMFDVVRKLWEKRQDFVVIAGNPSQKISNDKLAELCPAYVKLVPGSLNRDEYRHISRCADIVVGRYTNDTNGGLASLEAIEHGATPLFPNVYEYKRYFDVIDWPRQLRVRPDLQMVDETLDRLLDDVFTTEVKQKRDQLRDFLRKYASYESTTPVVMKRLGFV